MALENLGPPKDIMEGLKSNPFMGVLSGMLKNMNSASAGGGLDGGKSDGQIMTDIQKGIQNTAQLFDQV